MFLWSTHSSKYLNIVTKFVNYSLSYPIVTLNPNFQCMNISPANRETDEGLAKNGNSTLLFLDFYNSFTSIHSIIVSSLFDITDSYSCL